MISQAFPSHRVTELWSKERSSTQRASPSALPQSVPIEDRQVPRLEVHVSFQHLMNAAAANSLVVETMQCISSIGNNGIPGS